MKLTRLTLLTIAGTFILLACGRLTRAQTESAEVQVQTIAAGAQLYVLANPGSCPTVADLLRDGVIAPDTERNDPWGTAFRIVCTPEPTGVVEVQSAGPDESFGTGDDVSS